MIFTADTHNHPFRLCSRNGGADRRDDGLRAVEFGLQQAAERECAWVHLGDVKHVRGQWDQQALSGLLYLLGDKYRKVRKLLLSGNGYHDGLNVKESGASGLDPFRALQNCVVVTEPGIIRGSVLCPGDKHRDHNIAVWPWQPELDRLPQLLRDAQRAKARTLFAHGFLREAMVGPDDRQLPGVGTPMETFGLVGPPTKRVFDWGFFGDVHTQQVLGDPMQRKAAAVWYPGSPYQQNWGERGDTGKGVLFWDGKTVESLPTPGVPRYLRVVIDSEKQWRAVQAVKTAYTGNFVQLVLQWAPPSAELAAFEQRIQARYFQAIPAAPIKNKATEIEAVATHLSPEQMLEEYVRATPLPDVSSKLVLQVGQRFMQEAAKEEVGA